MTPSDHVCDLCDRPIPPHAHYVVRIDVFADPSMPATTGDELQSADFEQTVHELLEEMKDLTAEELQDQVHRRFEFTLCRSCQLRFLVNPLGKPRRATPSVN